MREYLQKLAGVRGNTYKTKENNVGQADTIRKYSGINENMEDIVVEKTEDADKIYLKLLEEFNGDDESINKIKDVFANIRAKEK